MQSAEQQCCGNDDPFPNQQLGRAMALVDWCTSFDKNG